MTPLPLPAAPHDAEAADIVAELRAWAVQTALPVWATVGFDHRHGGFHERLHLDGTPDREASRRTLIQARQIYVYSHAAVLGWYPEGLSAALKAFEFLLARCRAPDGKPGFVHRLTADLAVEAPLRDLYDHAFIIMALSWLAVASKDAQIVAVIDETLAFIDEHLAAGDGSFFEGLPGREPRRQNPHMHLFEATLALHKIGHPSAPARSEVLRGLLTGKFLDRQTGFLHEYFTADWRYWPGDQGGTIEPGHHAEWSWLLRMHDALSGRENDPLARTLLDRALRGAVPATGFLVDGLDAAGRITRGGRRCWPQTELAKAWLAEAELGRAGAAEEARKTLRSVARHYLSTARPGIWIDHFDAAGSPLSTHVPASTFYHLFCAIAEADRVLGQAPPG